MTVQPRDILMVADYLRGVPVRVLAPSPTSNAQLYRALERLGVTERRRAHQPDWWRDAAGLFACQYPIARIAVYVGKSRRAVQSALREMSLR